MIDRLLLFGTTVLLGIAFPLSVIAVRGYWGTPFGNAIVGLPVVILCFAIFNAPTILGVEASPVFFATTSSLAVLAAFFVAMKGGLLLTEWDEI